MARCLLILLTALLIAVCLAHAQPVTGLPDRTAYRGNQYSFNIVLSRADSALTSTALLYYDKAGRVLPVTSQPTVSRSGRTVTLAWSRTQTTGLPERAWLEISAGDAVRFNLNLTCNKNAAIIAQPGSLTVISPISDLSGPVMLPGNTSRTYPLQNVLYSGYTITHNRSNRLVTGQFFRDDTGQVDPLWRVEILTDNSIIVRGPPGETFSGSLVVNFPTNISN